VLFSAPFRRLQNKAQVFSLESNAAVRSRLTHSLEVSSIGRFVAQQAIKAFSASELETLGIAGKERPLITFVETACLLHDIGNPPFGHFGEIAISDWFHSNEVKPGDLGGVIKQKWDKYFADFRHFDGNPQGFRITTKLQPPETDDLCGLNLTATTLAATLKYPWTSESVGDGRKKAGYFHTENDVVEWIRETLEMEPEARHPLVYLMEAADDIAYCVSDIEDGIEKGLIRGREFAEYMTDQLDKSKFFAVTKSDRAKDAGDLSEALTLLKKPERNLDSVYVTRLTPMQDFRSAVIRLLGSQAGATFKSSQKSILEGKAHALLKNGDETPLLRALKDFAASSLYSSAIVRNREITAQAVLWGLLDAYRPLMQCERERFHKALAGEHQDDEGRPIARDRSLISRIPQKYLAVYHDAVRRMEKEPKIKSGLVAVLERILRMRLVVDHIGGMTDEFALQTFQLVSGAHINPYRN
jgi:dGTPase